MKLHPPPLPPAPGAKVQREEEEGNGSELSGPKALAQQKVAASQLRTFSSFLVPEDATRGQALTLAGPTLQ